MAKVLTTICQEIAFNEKRKLFDLEPLKSTNDKKRITPTEGKRKEKEHLLLDEDSLSYLSKVHLFHTEQQQDTLH